MTESGYRNPASSWDNSGSHETNPPALVFAFRAGRGGREQDVPSVSPAAKETEAKLTVHSLALKRDSRRSKRNSVLMRATLIGTDGAQTVRVKDLTSEGAGIACQVPVEVGSDVILRRGDLFIAARVVWADGMGAGLQFYRAVEPEELAASFMLS